MTPSKRVGKPFFLCQGRGALHRNILERHERLSRFSKWLPSEHDLGSAGVDVLCDLIAVARESLESAATPSILVELRQAARLAVRSTVVATMRSTVRELATEEVAAALQPAVDWAIEKSRIVRVLKYLWPTILGIVVVGGTVYGLQFKGMADQVKGDIMSAKDDALRAAEESARTKIAAQDAELNDLARKSKDAILDTRSAGLGLVNEAIDSNSNDIRQHVQGLWAIHDSELMRVVDDHQKFVVEQLDGQLQSGTNRMNALLGVIPARISILDAKLDDLKQADSNIALLLDERETFDRLVAQLDDAAEVSPAAIPSRGMPDHHRTARPPTTAPPSRSLRDVFLSYQWSWRYSIAALIVASLSLLLSLIALLRTRGARFAS